MTIEKIVYEVSKQKPSAQEMFIELLKGTLTEQEIKSLQIGIAVNRIFEDKELKSAMVSAMGKHLYTMFNKESRGISK